jgi:iron complex transport system substrate-binding protein
MKSPRLPACLALWLAALGYSFASSAAILLRDDVGRHVHASTTASRVVTLAPFLTDYVAAAGAADLLVGIAESGDPPPVMRRLPEVRDVPSFIARQLRELKPDLVLAFKDEIRPDEVEVITAAGVTVFVADPRDLASVPRLLAAIGALTGRDTAGAVREFEDTLGAVRASKAKRPSVRVFLEIWQRPLTTAGSRHFLSEALRECGADGIFDDLDAASPRVTPEEVQRRTPVAIIGVGSASGDAEFRASWSLRPAIHAVRLGRLHYLDWKAKERPTPRAAKQVESLCKELDKVREGIFAGANPRA